MNDASQRAAIKLKRWRATKRAKRPTLEEMKRVLRYEPQTGIFYWRVRRNSAGGPIEPGDPAGTLTPGRCGGYISIIVDQRPYRAHRLAWWFMTGEPAPKGIDVEHRDRDRANNRWSNLRLATRSQNNCNSGIRSDNRSGVKGVHPGSTKRATGDTWWFARITINKRIIHLGSFDSFENAVEARRAAERQYHGEFVPTGDAKK